ncbi:MAG: hypothetical protein ACR2JM_09175 [Mycobacterium sp.]
MAGSVKLVDSATAATLAQVLPVLLLTLAVEVRRNQLHRAMSRRRMAGFFILFGLIETLLVLSIDGAIYPFQWFDGISAGVIFGVMGILFLLSLSDGPAEIESI